MAGRRNVGVDVTSTSTKDLSKGAGYATAEGGAGSATFTKAVVADVITSPDDLIDLFDEEPEEGDGETDNPFRGKIKNEEWANIFNRSLLS